MKKYSFNVGLIEFYMAKNNLSKSALCKKANVSRYALGKILDNDLSVGFEEVMKIASVLGVNPADMLLY